jgi:hypothetical protein
VQLLTSQEGFSSMELVNSTQAVSRRRHRFETGSSHVGSVVDRVALGHVSSESFGVPCHFIYSTNFSTINTIRHVHRSMNSLSNSEIGSTAAPQIN